MVQEVNDQVRGRVHNDKLDQVPKVQGKLGELSVAGLLGAVKKLKGKKVLAVVDGVGFQLRVGQGFQDCPVPGPIDHHHLLSEGQGLGGHVKDADFGGVKVPEGGALAAAGFAQN